ncbi:unnamed protein product [Rotaria sp. Silwood1]|nr:unnamed protein product [Rotaria sp. Silwood1]
MLTSDEKQQCVQWAKKYINDDFNTTIFTDESSFQLFRNTVRRWTKNPNQEFKCSPKNRQKVHIWGAISVKGMLTCHTFRCNLDGPYYFSILEDYLLPAATIIGCVIIICGYIRVTAFNITAERQTRTIRQTLFQSILKKDVVYFDTHKTGELSTLISDDINKIRDGIGDKLGALIDTISIFICCIIIGFVKGWKLALVIFSTLPVIVTTFIITSKLITSLTTIELNAYRKAGAVAEEVITSIRTVLSYNGQEKEIQRSVYSLEHISPQFQALIQAQVAAYTVQEVIDEPSTINSDSETGLKKDDLIGDIRFSNVHFSYPSRRDVKVLTNLSFDVKRGQTVALIGSSGSGKSTCIQLLQRFYDQDSGSIFIDEKQINEYNLKWLRQHIGVVSQEPILFHATIRENILFGRDSATDEEIHEAAKMANAHDFIMTLPDKYETQVGERGAALSGGQKQRIAIARALIRNPKILLLDEATSALDNESEKIVQDALYRTAKGRTTLVIAHRLSTIRNADKIIVMQKGEIVEEGDHDSLMSIRGTYFTLIEQQSLHQAEEEEELEFEQQQAAKILLSDQLCLDNSNIKRNCSSTLVSITPSTLDVLYEKKNSRIDENREENDDEKIKTKKVFQSCDKDARNQKIILYALLHIGLGIVGLISQTLQSCMFAYSGETLTKRLRSEAFRAILRQEINYFDQARHNTGVLCTRLATEASAVQGASGIRFGFFCQNFVSIGMGIIIGFVFSWQLTLLTIAFLPLMIFGAYLQIRVTAAFESKDKEFIEDAGKV